MSKESLGSVDHECGLTLGAFLFGKLRMRRVAILIDGGFFLKRLPSVRPDVNRTDPVQVDRSIGQLIWSHLEHLK